MQRLSILAGLLAAAAAAPALAADYGQSPLFAPREPVTLFNWTGAYVGVGLGADVGAVTRARLGGNDAVRETGVQNGLRPSLSATSGTGFSGAGQIGYNYVVSPYGSLGGLNNLAGFDRGGVVVGAEADIGSAGTTGTSLYTSDRLSSFTAHTDFLGTVRARVGYAFGIVLVYASGGFAYGGVDSNTSFLSPTGAQTFRGGRSTLGTGYAVGGGVEVAVPAPTFVHLPGNGAFTARIDYLHYELGAGSYAVASTLGSNPGYTQSVRASGNLVRAGLNYKFDATGAVPAPVVARY